MKFEFVRLRGTLRPFKVLSSSAMPMGPDANVEKVTEVQLDLELDAEEALATIGLLFPFDVKKACQEVAGDDDRGGFKVAAHTRLGPMSVRLWAAGEEDSIFDASHCLVQSKPQLKVTEKGDATLIFRPKVRLSREEMAAVCYLVDADVEVTTESSQLDIPETTPLVSAA